MGNPSRLHEKAVALIAEACEGAYMQPWEWWSNTKREKNDPELQVYIRLTPEKDEWSSNLIEGVSKIKIPDPDWDSVGGITPDLILYGADDRPRRIVEVVVTNPPSAAKRAKLSRLQSRGVDVVEVHVRTAADLLTLLPPLRPIKFAMHRAQTHALRGSPAHGSPFGLDAITNALIAASPGERRRFLHVLQELKENLPDALYPTPTRLRAPQDAN